MEGNGMKSKTMNKPLFGAACVSVALASLIACGGGSAFVADAWAADATTNSATTPTTSQPATTHPETATATTDASAQTQGRATTSDAGKQTATSATPATADSAVSSTATPSSNPTQQAKPATPTYDGLTLIDGHLINYTKGKEQPLKGWKLFQKSWYYFNNSAKASENTWVGDYYLGSNGKMLTNTTVDWKGVKYRVDGSGKCIYGYGWHKQNGDWYFTNSNGTLKTNWLWYKGAWYLLDIKTGVMATGWEKAPNDKWYHFASWGGMTSPGWQWIGNSWYYFNGGGDMRTGWLSYGGNWYLLTDSGAMATGWAKAPDNKWYHFKTWGAMDAKSWVYSDTAWYYVSASGARHTGWLDYKGSRYYLDPKSGQMLTNTIVTIKNTRYPIGSDGTLAKSTWITDPATKQKVWVDSTGKITDAIHVSKDGVYTDKNGKKLSGLQHFGSDVIYADPQTGKARTGWQTINGSKYYFDPKTGFAHQGWFKLNNTWYYGQPNTGKVLTGWQWIADAWYYMRADGSMTTGWQWIDNNWYYLRDNGSMATGWQWISGKWWWMKSSGALAYKPAITGSDYIDSYMYGMAHDLGSLRAAFNWTMNHRHQNWTAINYARYKNGTTYWMADEIDRMLYGRPADCYAFSATFAALAQALGYNAKPQCGFVPSASAGWAAHSWVEIYENGQTYVYDPDLAHDYRGINWYGFTYPNAPTTYRKN